MKAFPEKETIQRAINQPRRQKVENALKILRKMKITNNKNCSTLYLKGTRILEKHSM